MPAMDLDVISRLGRELHTHEATGLMAEDEVCPWTLFLAMSLTLLKGVLPYVPKMLPVLVSDPEVRRRAEETFTDQEFIDNIDQYFIDNIKSDIQGPLNRNIIKSSETVMYFVKMVDTFFNTFLGISKNADFFPNAAAAVSDIDTNDLGKTDDRPRGLGSNVAQLMNFAKTLYQLTK